MRSICGLAGQEKEHMEIDCELTSQKNTIRMRAMIDSGATDQFIDEEFCKENGLKTKELNIPEPLAVFDGSPSRAGPITHEIEVILTIGRHVERLTFKVTKLNNFQCVLGLPWIKAHNPIIDWRREQLYFLSEHCKRECFPIHHLNATQSVSSAIAQEANMNKPKKAPEELVPHRYHQFINLFREEQAKAIVPPHRPEYDCPIDLVEGKEIKKFQAYAMTKPELEAAEKFIKEGLEQGIITKSRSAGGAPMFFVKKKDGSLRPVVDYRHLNSITKRNAHPLPLPRQLIDQLQGAKIFTKMDLRSGFHLIRIREGDQYKTAFSCWLGHFQYEVMPMGLTNAPAVFQNMMNDIFRDMLGHGVVIYLDDVLIYAKTHMELYALTMTVLERLEKHRLFLKPEKCEWETNELEYLGIRVSDKGIEMDAHKLDAINEWPSPRRLVELQAFLGFCNFYRSFIKNYSHTCRPLFDLLKKPDDEGKKKQFQWGSEAQKAFERLKAAYEKAPLMSHADPDKPFTVEADASEFATGAELSQKDSEGKRHPVAFQSKSLQPAERNYDIYDKELLAIIRAFKEWRIHLLGAKEKVTVYTDHKNLLYFTTTKTLTTRQARWAEFLSQFNFEIVYRPGKAAGRPDALSRRVDHEPTERPERVNRIFSPEQFIMATKVIRQESEYQILQGIAETVTQDEKLGAIITYLKGGGNEIKDYEWNGTMIYYQRKICVPDKEEIRRQILALYHDSKMAGHPGPKATQELIARNYHWPGMGQYVTRYVEGCDLCQRVKPRHHAPYGLLQPLPVPEKAWTDISVDFITGLPMSEGRDAILNVVDRKTKVAHFVPCNIDETSESTAQLFLRNIWRLHGLPERIVSDRGTQFNTKFMNQLYKLLDINASYSTAYHPESDGQTERVNQSVEDYLRMFVTYRQDDWVSLLPMAEFRYNNLINQSTGVSPFYAMYGYHPRFSPGMPTTETVPAADELARKLAEVSKETDAMLAMARERYKVQADKHRKEAPDFKVGDWVYLDGEHIKTTRPSEKLDHRDLGPYKIIAPIGKNAFRLELPPTMKIHNVFHVNRLEPKKKDEFDREPIPLPPVITEEGEEEWEVEAILDTKLVRGRIQYLVSWKGYGPQHNQWLPEKEVSKLRELIEEFYQQNPGAVRKSDPVKKRKTRKRN